VSLHGRPWGKLIKVDTSDEVLLMNRENTVGRKRGCDLSFPTNKLVSGEHCKIALDESSGLVWLEDTSTNGTVINMSKLVRKQTHVLQHGDIIHFVYRKSDMLCKTLCSYNQSSFVTDL
uniref:FHA domain-containing protein n=1 Tax=Periophthalmus magnuspinnatus TaxID=409849 RepID=A0A3B4BCP7_9GOBI